VGDRRGRRDRAVRWSGRLPAPLRPAVWLAIGGAGAILRWGAMAFDPPVVLLVPLQVLHACSFAAAHLGLMGFMARSVRAISPRGRRATSRRCRAW